MFHFFNPIQPKRRSRRHTVYRRGFRLGGNTLIWLLVFFMIGLFLQYGGRTQPLVAFWNDLKSLVGIRSTRPAPNEDNPYRSPEPTDRSRSKEKDSEASDDRSAPGRSKPETRGKGASTTKRFAFENVADFILPAPGPVGRLIRHEGFTLRYREEFEQADWVAYPLLENEVFGDADRDNIGFQPDPEVETKSALPSDYTRSGYDRGHLAPAGDFKFSQRMMRETFYMSNISPQAPQFNRGIWKELEEQVRAWAIRDKGLYVVTGPVLRPGLPTIGRQNKVAVPEYYYKVILYCNNPDIRMIGFLMKNEFSDNSLKQYVVSVDEIEKKTGIDFFPRIPDELEQKLESARPGKVVSEWFSF